MFSMPELPEVETVVRQLRPSLTGEELSGHEVFDHRLQHLQTETFHGWRVREVLRSGKQVVFGLEKGATERYLAVHLRMSGRLLWISNGQKGGRPGPEELLNRLRLVHDVGLKPQHVRFCLHGRTGTLAFADPRRFGTAVLESELRAFEPAGIDPTTPRFTEELLMELVRGSSQPIKPWLLRQDRLVGIGNIYASEILFRSGISPQLPANRLHADDVSRLAVATRQVLEEAIERSGTTFSDFQTPEGGEGGYQGFLAVYEREGEPCKVCEKPVKRVVQAGRSTYFCGGCQKLRKACRTSGLRR